MSLNARLSVIGILGLLLIGLGAFFTVNPLSTAGGIVLGFVLGFQLARDTVRRTLRDELRHSQEEA